MKISLKILFFSLLIILFQACSQNARNTQQKSLPNWYLNSLNNSALFLYGVGEGYSLKEAKTNALNDLSSRLLVKIDSVFQTQKSSSNGFYDKKINQDIKVEIEKMQFTNVKIEKNAVLNDRYYVLVKVNRQKQFTEKNKEFTFLEQSISKKVQSVEKQNKYKQILAIESLGEKIEKNRKNAFVLYALNNDFNYEKYFKKYDSLKNKVDTLKDELNIFISSNEKYNYFKDTVSSLLSEKNYKISQRANAHIKIRITNKVRHSKARSWNIAKITTKLSVIANKKIIKNKIFNTIGRSSSSKQNAIADASLEFEEILKDEDIEKLFFKK